MLDRGEVTREQFRELMAVHTREIIEEMIEVRRNPLVEWIESMRNRRAAAKLVHRHGETIVRQMFVALSDVAGFPLARWLWNADAPHMPLHCFIRSGREPVFRVVQITSSSLSWTLTVEHGKAGRGKATRERFMFTRDRFGQMAVTERSPA